jgi:Holliday junction resolvasome RuvABC endonuclease subunit
MVGKGPLAKDVASFADIFEVSRLHGVDTAVIEDGYVGKNPRVALALAMVRGSLAALAQQAGLRPVLVAPATWQTAMLSQGGWRPTTHKEIIPLVKLRVRSLHKLDLAEDEAVAVLLAEWGDAQRINAG